jgi:hypothetical protein
MLGSTKNFDYLLRIYGDTDLDGDDTQKLGCLFFNFFKIYLFCRVMLYITIYHSLKLMWRDDTELRDEEMNKLYKSIVYPYRFQIYYWIVSHKFNDKFKI